MSNVDGIGAASKVFTYCGHLLNVIKKLEQKIVKIQEENEKLKKFIDELQEKEETISIESNGGYDTIH